MRYFSVFASLFALVVAGCVAPPSEPPRPPLGPPPTPPPLSSVPLNGDWRDWPVTKGTWRYQRDNRGSRAIFAPPQTVTRLELRCDPANRRVLIVREGQTDGRFTIRTSSTTRTIQVRPINAASLERAAELAGRDPLLDAIAFSRGRFVIEQTGAPTLVVPVYAEIGRVIEDCRG